ncbi:hypothetical protein [Clostridium ljungdahlii]
MKKLVVKDKSLCMSCLSCEMACSEAFTKLTAILVLRLMREKMDV